MLGLGLLERLGRVVLDSGSLWSGTELLDLLLDLSRFAISTSEEFEWSSVMVGEPEAEVESFSVRLAGLGLLDRLVLAGCWVVSMSV